MKEKAREQDELRSYKGTGGAPSKPSVAEPKKAK